MQIFSTARPPSPTAAWLLLLLASLALGFGVRVPSPAFPSANPYRDPQVYAEILRLRDTILAGDYAGARSRCDALEKAHPDLMIPTLGRLLADTAEMFEQDNFLEEKPAQAELDHLAAVSRLISARRTWVYEDYLFLGGAYGGMGLHVSRRDDYLEAFRLGLIGLYYVSRADSLDSQPTDSQLAWGIFHYYRGYLAKSLPWLPVYANDMSQGLAEIRKAESGLYIGPVATLALAYVLGRGDKPETALPYSTQLYRRFPDSALIAIEHGRALLHNGRYPEAAALFQSLRLRVPQNTKILYYLGWTHTYWAVMPGVANPAEHRRTAENSLQLFLAAKPDAVYSSYAQVLLGDLDLQTQNLPAAKAHYQAALQLNPNYPAAHDRLKLKKGSDPIFNF